MAILINTLTPTGNTTFNDWLVVTNQLVTAITTQVAEKGANATFANIGVTLAFTANTVTAYSTATTLFSANVATIKTSATIANNVVWHAGNDGAASGLDADLLDGQQGTYYATAANTILTGVPVAPTANSTTNSTQIATTAYVTTALTNQVHAAANTSVNGFMSAADKAKLDTVASSATANQTDTYLLARGNHTGTQTANTISDLSTILALKANAANAVHTGTTTTTTTTFDPAANVSPAYIATGAFGGGYVMKDGTTYAGMWTSGASIQFGIGTASAMTVVGSLSSTGFSSPNNVSAYSDARLKTDIETITGALELVNNLRGVRYTRDNIRHVGVIAQEVQEVIPELVDTNHEYLAVYYANMVGVLIEAIKELSAKVDKLEGK